MIKIITVAKTSFCKYLCYIFLIWGFLVSSESFSQGLKFNGGEMPIDKRTSYNVFSNKSVEFSQYFNIECNLSLYPDTPIGYIIRIKNEKSNTIYNLFYDGQGQTHTFSFNEEGKSNLFTAEIDMDELLNVHWFKMRISFDLKNDSIKLTIHDHTFGAGNANLPDKYSPVIIFGKSDHIIDVPSFGIKDLSVGNQEKYSFPLKESEGDIVHDSNGKALGEVSNPRWLINDSYHWTFLASFKSKTVAGANYNPEKKEIYYFNQDSVYIYNVRSGKTGMRAFSNKCPVQLALGTNFINTKNHRLYAYEVYNDRVPEEVTMASIDLTDFDNWETESTDELLSQLHHHGSYFDPSTSRYTIFGGFGNMHYNQNFYSFDFNSKEWQILGDFKGDVIFPRYFSSLGYLEKTNSIYIFGGMGNESGEQVVGRKYFYDLHEINLTTKQIIKRWEIPWNEDNVVPVRGMVILNDSCFYTLCYPEHFSDSYLRLYQFSLKDGSYKILGNSIPIHSDRITTNANLYYDKQLNSLYAIVQEFDDDIVSDLKVYSLAFPPITAEDLVSYQRSAEESAILIIIISCVVIITVTVLFFMRKSSRKVHNMKHRLNKNALETARPNSVYLFGDFTVLDRSGKDITYMFSVRLKQVFCLILQYSMEGGITSQRLSNLLWPDKPEDKVKNSRGVTINHLRKALSELDGIELVYNKGCFRIEQSEEFYCDYTRCMQIISANDTEGSKQELVKLLARGKFLKSSDQSLFDSFKTSVEHKLEPGLLLEMEKSFETEAYQTTINFAEIIFNMDPLNDQALAYQIKALQRLKMDEEARIKYQAFVVEYKKTMGNDYPHSFKDLSRINRNFIG
ncbi:DNA-binding transcriptional activator [Dysgonomonas termitidis]|uniref:DNA-binding transcriptional activator n=2 Tax=Dysgonomonas termitidis TaxID=1516126 RepID=A0ABV9KW33_9BACT